VIPRAALQVRAKEWGLTEEVVEKDEPCGLDTAARAPYTETP